MAEETGKPEGDIFLGNGVCQRSPALVSAMCRINHDQGPTRGWRRVGGRGHQ